MPEETDSQAGRYVPHRGIGDQGFGLNDPATNTAMAARLLAARHQVLETYPQAELVQREDDASGEIALIGLRSPRRIEYYVRYRKTSHEELGRCASRARPWRSLTASVTGLAEKVLDGVLLRQFDSIASDGEHTEASLWFWTTQIAVHADLDPVGIVDARGVHVFPKTGISLEEWLSTFGDQRVPDTWRGKEFFVRKRPGIDGPLR